MSSSKAQHIILCSTLKGTATTSYRVLFLPVRYALLRICGRLPLYSFKHASPAQAQAEGETEPPSPGKRKRSPGGTFLMETAQVAMETEVSCMAVTPSGATLLQHSEQDHWEADCGLPLV